MCLSPELLRTWSCSASSAGGPGPLWGPSALPWWSLRGVGSMWEPELCCRRSVHGLLLLVHLQWRVWILPPGHKRPCWGHITNGDFLVSRHPHFCEHRLADRVTVNLELLVVGFQHLVAGQFVLDRGDIGPQRCPRRKGCRVQWSTPHTPPHLAFLSQNY